MRELGYGLIRCVVNVLWLGLFAMTFFWNNKPVIKSNGGGDKAHVDVNENTRFVTDVETSGAVSTEANGRLRYSIVGGADAHLFEIDARNGQLFFKQAPDFENPRDAISRDSIYDVKIQVKDAAGYTDSQLLSVKVKNVQEAPNAQNDLATVISGQSVSINVLGNDSDPDGDALVITSLNGQPIAPGQTIATANGSVTLQANGQLGFTPNPGFVGSANFSYHVSDGNGGEDTAQVEVAVAPRPNQAPNANNDTASTTVGTPVTINVLANDSDPNGDLLSITSLNGRPIAPGQTVATANGSVTLQPNGQLSFAPNTGFVGNEVFSYHVNDGKGGEDTAQVQVSINAPVDPKTGFIGNRVFFDANQNGVQDNGEGGAAGIRVTLTSAGQDGTIGTFDDVTVGSQVTADGGFYGFNNLAADTYKVTFSNLPADRAFTTPDVGGDEARDSDANPANGMTANINLVPGQSLSSVDAGVVAVNRNQAPDAVNDTASTTVGTPVTINALGNDTDPNGDPLAITSLNGQSIAPGQTVPTANGSVTLQPNGQLSFAPNAGFTGTETFSYHANDGRGGEDTAQVQVRVNAPVDPKTGFIGNRVFFDANQNGVQDNGEGGVDGVRVTLVGAGSDGAFGSSDDVVRTQTTGNGGFYGFGSLGADQYKVGFSQLPNGLSFTAAKVGINNNIDSDADPTTGVTGIINLAPGQSLSSVDAGLVEVNRNQAPNAVNDSASTTVGTPVTINALANDTDPNGDPLSITSLNGRPIAPGQTVATANGAVTLRPNGQLSFAPNAGFVGNEVFSYHVNDGNGGEDTAQVQVSVNALVDPKTGFIGNRVFFDANANGIHDNGEGGFGGVRVTLTGGGQDGVIGTGDDVKVGSQVVGDNGYYGFSNLAAGNYKVTFSQVAPGFGLTAANVGSNEALDSDADPVSGMTGVIALAPAEFNSAVDAGIVKLQGGGKNEIFGTERADWPLKGTDGADSIFGLGGNDKLEGLGGNDHLSGGAGNDHLLGGAGDDTVNGTNDLTLGRFEVDTLTGGAGRDRFILTNNDTSYYFGDEWGGFAVIKDFSVGEDVAVLHGPASQYSLEVHPGLGSTTLYCLSDSAGKSRDAIAVFEGNTNLNLASSSFQFIG